MTSWASCSNAPRNQNTQEGGGERQPPCPATHVHTTQGHNTLRGSAARSLTVLPSGQQCCQQPRKPGLQHALPTNTNQQTVNPSPAATPYPDHARVPKPSRCSDSPCKTLQPGHAPQSAAALCPLLLQLLGGCLNGIVGLGRHVQLRPQGPDEARQRHLVLRHTALLMLPQHLTTLHQRLLHQGQQGRRTSKHNDRPK